MYSEEIFNSEYDNSISVDYIFHWKMFQTEIFILKMLRSVTPEEILKRFPCNTVGAIFHFRGTGGCKSRESRARSTCLERGKISVSLRVYSQRLTCSEFWYAGAERWNCWRRPGIQTIWRKGMRNAEVFIAFCLDYYSKEAATTVGNLRTFYVTADKMKLVVNFRISVFYGQFPWSFMDNAYFYVIK